MKIIKKTSVIQKELEKLRLQGKRIGIVPTMGYLHEGHLSLLRMARKKCDILVLTIFVNPTQFGANEDFGKYPRNVKKDISLAKGEKVDYVFCPEAADMYPDGYQTYVVNKKMAYMLEGEFRPIHFEGVATVVTKLFNLIKPQIAFFGQKDYQQAQIIKQMVRDLNFGIKIEVAPIIREKDGLAMSSRNVYLSPVEREDALVLNRSLLLAESLIKSGELNCKVIIRKIKNLIEKKKTAKIDYVRILNTDNFGDLNVMSHKSKIAILLAVRIGKTRLIDNKIISVR